MLQDLRFAVRLLLKGRGFTVVAVAALALAIGAGTSIFAFVNAMAFRGFLAGDADRILYLGTTGSRTQTGLATVSYPDFRDWQAAASALEGLAAHSDATMNVSDVDQAPARLLGTYISANGFGLLGVQPAIGRTFAPADDEPGALAVAILSHDVWQGRYGGDPEVVGRTVRINEVPTTVVGVMGESFKFPMHTDVWQPLARLPGLAEQPRDARTLSAFGRLVEGVGLAQAQEEIGAIAARLSDAYPETNRGVSAQVVRMDDWYLGPTARRVLHALLASVGLVLLIACGNVANLLLARSVHRTPEIATRMAVGAPRARVLQQLLVESLVLATFAGIFGLALALIGIQVLAAALVVTNPPYWVQLAFDARAFAILLLASFGTAIVFGLVPALALSKTNVQDALQEGGRSGGRSLRSRYGAAALVTLTLAFTLILLGGAGLLMRSLLALYAVDVGVDTRGLTMVELELPPEKYGTPGERILFHQRLRERLEAVPVFDGVTVASAPPGSAATRGGLDIEGRPSSPDRQPPTVTLVHVDEGYFPALGLESIRGRTLTREDGAEGRAHVVVNERFAAMHFAAEDPVGRRIRVAPAADAAAGTSWLTIVGVTPTVQQNSLWQDQPEAVVYLPYRADPVAAMTLLVESAQGSEAVASQIRDELRHIDSDLPVFNVQTVDHFLSFSRLWQRTLGGIFVGLATIALLVSAVGLYGVTAYAVTQRTREIGVRVALGARSPQVVWLFTRRALAQLAAGLVLGLAGAFYVGHRLEVLLVHTGPRDPLALASVAALLVAVALAACLWPALRAARVDPVSALRHD